MLPHILPIFGAVTGNAGGSIFIVRLIIRQNALKAL